MSDERPLAHLDREDPDGLLNARSDPASAGFGTLGSEAGSDLNWFLLLPQRVQDRAAASSHYLWWVLWSLLAGLFALNFTFTVFIVALPTVATQFRTSTTVLTWTMVGPLLAYGLAAPMLGKTSDIYGHRRLYLFGLVGAMPSSSSVMANEVKVSEFGVMSAAQLLAMQVGEVAGIQVLETVQQSIARRRRLSHAPSGPALLATFDASFGIGACVGGVGLVAAMFIRSIPRRRPTKTA